MTIRFFSDKNRPVHLGPYPLERLLRTSAPPDLEALPAMPPLSFHCPETPDSIVDAMGEYQAMLDAIRVGLVNKSKAGCPDDPVERAEHLKAFGYFSDASLVGIGSLEKACLLDEATRNPDIDRLASDLRTRQTTTLASGIDMIMADLKESMEAPPGGIGDHRFAIVFLYEYPRDPDPHEPGSAWIQNAQAARACLRASETAVVIANYIRLLGHDARAHTPTASDIHLHRHAVAAGLAGVSHGCLVAPYVGERFELAAVTTSFELGVDRPLAPLEEQP
ncbi:MAG: NAD-binding oxidoreductase, partial [Geminicoccaceae bacterium]